jgi:hypothetical protein
MKKSQLRQIIKQTIREVKMNEADKHKTGGYISGDPTNPVCLCDNGKKFFNCGQHCECCDLPANAGDLTIDPTTGTGPTGGDVPNKEIDPTTGTGPTGGDVPKGKLDEREKAGGRGCLCNSPGPMQDTTFVPIYSPHCCPGGSADPQGREIDPRDIGRPGTPQSDTTNSDPRMSAGCEYITCEPGQECINGMCVNMGVPGSRRMGEASSLITRPNTNNSGPIKRRGPQGRGVKNK